MNSVKVKPTLRLHNGCCSKTCVYKLSLTAFIISDIETAIQYFY